jgi:hypothetical protein
MGCSWEDNERWAFVLTWEFSHMEAKEWNQFV